MKRREKGERRRCCAQCREHPAERFRMVCKPCRLARELQEACDAAELADYVSTHSAAG